MDKPFDLQPSELYLQRKAESERADAALSAAQREALDKGSEETWRFFHEKVEHRAEEMREAHRKLKETPEQQYLNELDDTRNQAWDKTHDDEVEKRGKMAAVIGVSLDEDPSCYASIVDEIGLSHRAGNFRPIDNDLLQVHADMRRLSPKQVVEILRHVANEIEDSGIVVYQGTSPIHPDRLWYADERIDGTYNHQLFNKD